MRALLVVLSLSLAQPPGPSATFGPPLPGTGFAIGDAVVLRSRPSPSSPVIATLKGGATDGLEVLGVSGSFVRVRGARVAGWASARQAMPHTVAFVLDARTGATVARLPVGSGQQHVVFSPDGSRAVISGFTSEGPRAAYELRTSDFAPTRSITATGVGGKPAEIVAAFFGGPERALYAVVFDDEALESSRLAVVRVGDEGAPAEPPALRCGGQEFVVSPDGRVGFAVVDLGALAVHNTISLRGDLAASFNGIVPSADGSELYLLGDVTRVRVLDAATGREKREVRTGWEPNAELSLQNLCSGGRSLLIAALGNSCEITVPEGAWWVAGTRKVRGPELALSVDTGRARYAVDGDARHLLRFGAGGRVMTKAAIAQPDLAPVGHEAWPLAIVASPDGSRLVIFVSYGEVFCPC